MNETTPATQEEQQVATDQQTAAQPESKKESQEPAAPPPARTKRGWGCLAWPLQIFNSPWLLATVPLLMAGIWLMNNTWIITNNLDKPYLLAAGPAAVASVVVGWLIIKFFTTIATWCRSAWQAFQRGRKEDANGQFFWLTIAVFMAVSVMESGQFFDTIIHHVIPGLGYATAFVIDLIAVNLMQARLEAVRMHDKKGASLYLIGVAVCAGLSAFANLYTALSGFSHVASGELPIWMNNLAPWLAMAFPAMILLMSLTADYSLDRTSTKLDAAKYREQENKRMEVLKVRRDMDKERLGIEQELAQIAHKRKSAQGSQNDREFILVRLLFPRKPVNAEKIMADASAQIRAEFGKHLRSLSTQIHHEIGQAYQSAVSQNGGQIQGIQQNIQQIDWELNVLIDGWNTYKNTVTIESLIDQLIQRELVVKVDANEGLHPHEMEALIGGNKAGQTGTKTLTFTPTAAHKKTLELIEAHPEWRAKFAEILRINPGSALQTIASFLRHNGLNHSSLTPSLVGEVLAMLQLFSEIRETREQITRTPKPAKKPTLKNTGRELVNAVNGPATGVNRGEETVKLHAVGERKEAVHQDTDSTVAPSSQVEDLSSAEEERASSERETVAPSSQVEDLGSVEEERASSERETDPRQVAVQPSSSTTITLESEQEPGTVETQIDVNTASDGTQNTGAIEALALPKITRPLTPEMLPDVVEKTGGFSEVISSEGETSFSTNGEQYIVNTPLNQDDIPSDFEREDELIALPISTNLPTGGDEGAYEFDANFDEEDERYEGEFEGNRERSTRRGPYHLTAEEIAEKYACTIDHVKYSVEQNQLRLSNRTDQDVDPVESWKILTSSLEGWTPPTLPKKRGRPAKKNRDLVPAR